MDRMLYIAMAAAKQTMQSQAVVANNLANINTSGFRRDLETSMHLNVVGDGAGTRAYASLTGLGFDASVGHLETTGNPLDVAVQGAGWIVVQGMTGRDGYTRAGNLQVDPSGTLMTSSGQLVMGEGGPITLPPFDRIEIGSDGTISIRPPGAPSTALAIIDRVLLVNPPVADLEKGADGLMYPRDGVPDAEPDAAVRLASGVVESSNVNGVEQMVRQIELARRFDLQVKMMSEASEMDDATDSLLQSR
jgi:flagellar basal-body rod protein FlgF